MARQIPKSFDTAFETYEVESIIGEGGSGRVLKAVSSEDRIFAIKYLNPDRISTNKVQRFKNELFYCIKNRHRNIITIHDYGYAIIREKKVPFYVMPYYSSTLRKIMGGGIQPNQVLPLFSQLLDGLEAAHLLGVWHRDIKPENVLFDAGSNTIVLTDFGIAHFSEEYLQTLVETKAQDRLANFQYAAPEQKVFGIVDGRVDIFALGLILNEMFTGEIPQGAGYKTIDSINSDFSYLDSLVEKMIRQSPDERPNNIEEIKIYLRAKKNEFISLQELNRLKEVVSQNEIDDPLVLEAVRLNGDIDYRDGRLYLGLNHHLTPEWKDTFHSITPGDEPVGLRPQRFRFTVSKDKNEKTHAFIQVSEGQTQTTVNVLKEHLTRANEKYKKSKVRQQLLEDQKHRREHEEKIRNEEIRQRVLKNTQI